MARLDRGRLEAGHFPSLIDIPTRFADMDMQFHVSNVASIVMLQEGRAHINGLAGLRNRLDRLRALVAGITVEYAGEIRHPGTVRIGSTVLSVGRTSVRFGQVAWQNGTPCLYAESVMVLAEADGPVPIPDDLRAVYERLRDGDG